jgi:hypothetical protein
MVTLADYYFMAGGDQSPAEKFTDGGDTLSGFAADNDMKFIEFFVRFLCQVITSFRWLNLLLAG